MKWALFIGGLLKKIPVQGVALNLFFEGNFVKMGAYSKEALFEGGFILGVANERALFEGALFERDLILQVLT